jgi:hypothetical protein
MAALSVETRISRQLNFPDGILNSSRQFVVPKISRSNASHLLDLRP